MKDALPAELVPAREGISSGGLSSAIQHGQAETLPPWDSAEALAEIQRLVAAGLTTRQIGERWGVSRNAVQKRLDRQREKARFGVKQDPALPDWRSEEASVEILRLRREGRKPVEIARLFGVSSSAVFKRFAALPEDYEPKRRAPVPEVVPEWSSEHAGRMVVELREGGWSQTEISALFGVTDNAVRKRLRRIAARGGKLRKGDENASSAEPGAGAAEEDRAASSEVAPGALPAWNSPGIEDELRRLHEAGMPLAEMARRFGVARSTVRDRLVRLKIVSAPGSSPRQEPGERKEDDLVEKDPVPDQGIVVRPSFDLASLVVPSGCRWPMWGDAERPTHVYCGKPVVRDRWPGVYCEECRAKAFRRVAVMAEA
jgi:DNA-directed RNA polymerase specialized sigma24 family protein